MVGFCLFVLCQREKEKGRRFYAGIWTRFIRSDRLLFSCVHSFATYVLPLVYVFFSQQPRKKKVILKSLTEKRKALKDQITSWNAGKRQKKIALDWLMKVGARREKGKADSGLTIVWMENEIIKIALEIHQRQSYFRIFSSRFLEASTHLHKRSYQSVRPSVHLSIQKQYRKNRRKTKF